MFQGLKKLLSEGDGWDVAVFIFLMFCVLCPAFSLYMWFATEDSWWSWGLLPFLVILAG